MTLHLRYARLSHAVAFVYSMLLTRALNLLQLVTGALQYNREGNVTIKCLQSITRYDILLQRRCACVIMQV